jgi:hypothetical protein
MRAAFVVRVEQESVKQEEHTVDTSNEHVYRMYRLRSRLRIMELSFS